VGSFEKFQGDYLFGVDAIKEPAANRLASAMGNARDAIHIMTAAAPPPAQTARRPNANTTTECAAPDAKDSKSRRAFSADDLV